MSSKQTSSETERLQQGRQRRAGQAEALGTTGAEEEEDDDEDEEEQQQWEKQRDTRGRQVAVVSHPNGATKNNSPDNYISKRLKNSTKKTTKLDKHGSGDANTAASAVSSIVVRPEDSNLHSVFVQSRFFFSLQSKTNFNIMTGNVKKREPRGPWWW